MIKLHRGHLLNGGKNLIYEFPNGFRLVMARTPSDRRAGNNSLSLLRRGLRLNEPKPEPPPAEPVLQCNEARCAWCRRISLFPTIVPEMWECSKPGCGQLNIMEETKNGNH